MYTFCLLFPVAYKHHEFEVVQNGILCKTEPKEVEKNGFSSWTYLQLDECVATTFNGNVDTIQFEMQTDLDDDFCSKHLKVNYGFSLLSKSL